MSEIKIRTLPRKNERLPGSAPEPQRLARLMMGLSVTALCLGILGFLTTQEPIQRKLAKATKVTDRHALSVNKHMYDTHLKEEMLKRKFELENRVTAPKKFKVDAADQLPDDNRSYGVQLDQDDAAEKLYEELNGHLNKYGDNLDEKINQRLANRKWLNQQEREERITFVKNFIRLAYERGYEVELDSNLVVTGVKKITQPKSVNIDKVLERIAKQGY